MKEYKVLNQQVYSKDQYSIVPIRHDDRYDIMKWRNEQMYHLRQRTSLTKDAQDQYFNSVVAELLKQDKPEQILFSFLKNDVCIGYGGLVHINWTDNNAEISFIMESSLEEKYFEFHWQVFLGLIEQVGFNELNLYKIFTYAFDIRPKLYNALEKNGYYKDAVLKSHCLHDDNYIDVLIHAKINASIRFAEKQDIKQTYAWANNPIVRKYSFNKEYITWEQHTDWFLVKLKDTNCFYFILETNGYAVGSIRFDITEKIATVSYLVNPDYHGRGWGIQILKKGIDELIAVNKAIVAVEGWVLPDNKASINIFEKLGFLPVETDSDNLKFRLALK